MATTISLFEKYMTAMFQSLVWFVNNGSAPNIAIELGCLPLVVVKYIILCRQYNFTVNRRYLPQAFKQFVCMIHFRYANAASGAGYGLS